MKVLIKGEEKALQPLKGRVVKNIRNMMFDVMKEETDAQQAIKTQELMDKIDEEAAVIAGLSIEQLDDLDVDEKAKITGYIVGKINDTLDFLRSSSQRAN